MKTHYLSYLFMLALLLTSLNTVAAPLSFDGITAKGSINGAGVKQLNNAEFRKLQTNGNSTVGTWSGLVRHLDSAQPEVHIVDGRFYSDARKLGFKSTFGIHEAYSRYHGIAANTSDFIGQVMGLGSDKKLLPFTLHIPLNGPISTTAGDTINWVFQSRRYGYKDSSESFAKALIKGQQVVRSHLFKGAASNFKPAFITYDKPGHRRPNLRSTRGKKDILALKKAGFTVISERERDGLKGLAERQVYIMNAGHQDADGQHITVGILKHITDLSEDGIGENSINSLTAKDIAVFDALPPRIPPVAGIIVLERQTELSHVNILAKNRDTLNVSLNSTDENLATNDPAFIAEVIAGFKPELYGKTVQLQLKGSLLSLKEVSQQQLVSFLQKQREVRGQLDIVTPEVFDSTRWLLDPAKEKLGSEYVGAKASNYGLIQNWLNAAGIILPGRAIGFNLYLKTVQLGGPEGKPEELIRSLIAERSDLPLPEINKRLKAIQKAIKAIPLSQMPMNADGKSLSEELSILLNNKYRDVGRIRLRSSTNSEDLPTFNGAGLYESKGMSFMKVDASGKRIINQKKLWKKLKQVMASLWLPRAFHERDYFGIDHAKVAMAIQINPAFSDKWLNGVRRKEWGNGVALYDEKGGVKTLQLNSQFSEASVTNPLAGELPESLVFVDDKLQQIKARSSLQGRAHTVFLHPVLDALNRADVSLLKQLQDGVKVIFDNKVAGNPDPVFKSPERYGIDVEYKIMWDYPSGKKLLFIKQARPLALGA